ncbi:MAG: YtxH domain-containing protein [Myxococcota bacterium]
MTIDGLQQKLKTIRSVLAAAEAFRNARGITTDDVLARVGLERRRSGVEATGPWLGGFSAGMMVGGAMGLLLAPMPGSELRNKLRTRANELVEELSGLGQHADDRPGGFESSEGAEPPGPRA